MKKDKNVKKLGTRTVTGEPAMQVDVHPTDKSIREHVVLTFGRFNPPTIGHQHLVEFMHTLSEDADVHVYLSHRTDNRSNPLEYDTKLQLCKEAFGDCVVESDCRGLFEILESLSGKYKKATVVVGSDRALEFAERISLYNGDLYHFESLNVVEFDRPPAAISSTRMRQYVVEGDISKFQRYLPEGLADQGRELFETLLADLKSSDFKLVKALSPLGKWVWRKVKRNNNMMKKGINNPLKPLLAVPQTEEVLDELSQRSVISYINKASNERGTAEKFGDKNRFKKRDKGLDSAVNRMHKWYGKK